MKQNFFLTIISLCAPLWVLAQLGGETSFNSLNIPSSARIGALGGNQIASRDGDLNLGIYNPSLLNEYSSGNLSLSYVSYFADINFGFASFSKNIDSTMTAAATLQYVNYGSFDALDETGLPTGTTFNAGDYALITGISRKMDSLFSIGANLKVLYSNIESYSSIAAAVDLGGSYFNPRNNLSIGLVIKNLGYQFATYSDEVRENLPAEIQIGFAKRLKHAPFQFSMVLENLQKWDLTDPSEVDVVLIDPATGEVIEENNFEFGDKLMRHVVVGAELFLSNNLQFRFGYNYRRRKELQVTEKPGTAGLSWGLGLQIKKYQISYGRATYHLVGASNHFTFTTKIGKSEQPVGFRF